SAVISRPCFVVMPQTLKLAGAAEIVEVPVVFDDLSFDIAGIEKVLGRPGGVKMAMFATPENPTGAVLDSAVVLDWCKRFPDTLFVIDEAYIEFAVGNDGLGGGRDRLMIAACELDNLIVLRTFSKGWAMAGLRLGIMVGKPEMLAWINRSRSPFNVNAAAVWTALKMLDNAEAVWQNAREIYQRKEQLVDALRQRNFQVNNGQSNCLLLSLGCNAKLATDYLQSNGVLVRNRSASVVPVLDSQGRHSDPLWGMVRVSAGTAVENEKFLELLDRFNRSYAVMFDLDGTLVDTSASFDATVETIVERYSGSPLAAGELNNLRAEGGFNDDWVAAHELLRRRGVEKTLKEIVNEATPLYLQLAVEHEAAYFDEDLLPRTRERHPMFIVTGRTRQEYDPVWGSRLDPLFERVYCLFDVPGGKPKPAPDYLLKVKEDYRFVDGVYVGNSVDDMRAAREAGLAAIAVTTTLPAETLREAGAQMVLSSVNELKKVFCI
ncbi:MAG: aminotransferase class I/II-fold pyridoxal phosphate-dependent enzyme, partial [Cyanobacteria bacterium SZAS TMP-1]|nr:aminotransferase class I/II-fold pyridoxal phosphate-dependent enzyme [Cyanobacteria bacterium SZAS TMP-1]